MEGACNHARQAGASDPETRPAGVHPQAGRVDVLVLPEHRLALLRLRGDVALPQLLEAARAAYAERPETPGFDLVTDLREHTGHLGVEGIKAATALRLESWPDRRPSREVLLSRDTGMVFVARYLDLLAPHVEHRVMAEPAEAIAYATGGPVPPVALAFLDAP